MSVSSIKHLQRPCFCLTGLKLTKRISYTGRAEMWTRFSFWRVPVSARFHGITLVRVCVCVCIFIYCAKHRFISEPAGCMESSAVSHIHTHTCVGPSTQHIDPDSEALCPQGAFKFRFIARRIDAAVHLGAILPDLSIWTRSRLSIY